MWDSTLIVPGFTICSEDGVLVRLEQAFEREEVILSLTRGEHSEKARLTKAQWNVFCEERFKLDIFMPTKTGEEQSHDRD